MKDLFCYFNLLKFQLSASIIAKRLDQDNKKMAFQQNAMFTPTVYTRNSEQYLSGFVIKIWFPLLMVMPSSWTVFSLDKLVAFS